MPIYAYRCTRCGLQKDVMQKISDAPLSICPECGTETFTKQLTSAGFQLKGSGYYVTDFKSGPKKPDADPETNPDAVAAPAGGASTAAADSAP